MNILSFAIGLTVGAAGVAVFITIILRKKKRNSLKQKLTPHMPEFPESVDSGMALLSNADYLYAIENRALAATWHTSKFACNIPSHQDRDLQTFTIRNSWGIEKGLVRLGTCGFLDELSLPRCGCYLTYLYNLRSLPPEMLTEKYAKLSKKTK